MSEDCHNSDNRGFFGGSLVQQIQENIRLRDNRDNNFLQAMRIEAVTFTPMGNIVVTNE